MTSAPSNFAEYIAEMIRISGKTQKVIAREMGYEPSKANIITMFKQSIMKMPIARIPAFAKSVGADPAYAMRLALREYSPAILEVVESSMDNIIVTRNEAEIIQLIRDTTGDADPRLTEKQRNQIIKIFKE